MSEKRRPHIKRHFISLERKLQILDRLQEGHRVSHVAKALDLNEATIRTIQRNERKIRSSLSACSISANMTSRARAPIIEKMEIALSIWIDDCNNKQIPLDTNIIKRKALQIYNYLKEIGESANKSDFVASKGWFNRFRKRFLIQNLKTRGSSAAESSAKEMQEDKILISENEKVMPTVESEEIEHLNLKNVKKGLNLAKQLELYFLEEDPSSKRSMKFKKELQKCLAPYNEIYEELLDKSKQFSEETSEDDCSC